MGNRMPPSKPQRGQRPECNLRDPTRSVGPATHGQTGAPTSTSSRDCATAGSTCAQTHQQKNNGAEGLSFRPGAPMTEGKVRIDIVDEGTGTVLRSAHGLSAKKLFALGRFLDSIGAIVGEARGTRDDLAAITKSVGKVVARFRGEE